MGHRALCSSWRCLSVSMKVLLRLGLLAAVFSAGIVARAQKPAPTCCEPRFAHLSSHKVKAPILRTAPIRPLGEIVHIDESVVLLAVAVGADGKVSRIKVISGHPMLFGSAIDSVRQSTFTPYLARGVAVPFCGKIVLRIRGDEHEMRYDVLRLLR